MKNQIKKIEDDLRSIALFFKFDNSFKNILEKWKNKCYKEKKLCDYYNENYDINNFHGNWEILTNTGNYTCFTLKKKKSYFCTHWLNDTRAQHGLTTDDKNISFWWEDNELI